LLSNADVVRGKELSTEAALENAEAIKKEIEAEAALAAAST